MDPEQVAGDPEIEGVNGRDLEPDDLPTLAPEVGALRPLQEQLLAQSATPRIASIELDSLSAGERRVAAASVVGLGHAYRGSSRQDAYDLTLGAAGELYVTVADGLGSRASSALGARLFCDRVSVRAAEAPVRDENELRGLVVTASEGVAKVARDGFGLDAADVACVCVVAVVRDADVCVARVGDATVFRLGANGFSELFERDEDDDGFINIVSATVPGAVDSEIESMTCDLGDDTLIVVSDGVANDLRHSPAIREWLAARWRRPLRAFAMGDSLRYRRQGSHDDRTAAVVWPRPCPTQEEI